MTKIYEAAGGLARYGTTAITCIMIRTGSDLSSQDYYVVRTVVSPVSLVSRSRTTAKLQYGPRVDIMQHGCEYVPLTTACWPDWLPTETRF